MKSGPYLSLTILLLAQALTARAQHLQQTKPNFAKDSINNTLHIFSMSGPDPVAFSKKDSLFEKKYCVKYVLFGCESDYDFEDMYEYNIKVERYLDRRFGKKWRLELRDDAVGIVNEKISGLK